MRLLVCAFVSALSFSTFAAGETDPMKKPVDSTTEPKATTGKDQASKQDADNTKRNEVHDGKHAVTADQQGNSKSDVELTARIRRAVVDDKALSTYAHNVKIISKDGSVVLKGPVRSNDEKSKIETVAKSIAGDDKVVSEIEIKAK